jgi:hypothetical protein
MSAVVLSTDRRSPRFFKYLRLFRNLAVLASALLLVAAVVARMYPLHTPPSGGGFIFSSGVDYFIRLTTAFNWIGILLALAGCSQATLDILDQNPILASVFRTLLLLGVAFFFGVGGHISCGC